MTISALGGFVGLGGSAIGRAWSLGEKLLEFSQERARWAHELQLTILAQQARAVETESAEWLVAEDARAARLEERDAVRPADANWVNAARSLTRPALTLGLWIAVLVLALYYRGEYNVVTILIDAIAYSATSSAAWWFGDRAQIGRAKS